jgi:hypothetical protein
MTSPTRTALLLGALLGCGRASPPSAPIATGPRCEVEIAGKVQETVTGNRTIAVYVSAEDCGQPGARTIERALANGDGSFFAEVWGPCGVTLTACAAVEPRVPIDGEPKPTRRWGKYEGAMHAVGDGEIEFFGLTWALRDQPERTFARPQPLMAPPPGHMPRNR